MEAIVVLLGIAWLPHRDFKNRYRETQHSQYGDEIVNVPDSNKKPWRQ